MTVQDVYNAAVHEGKLVFKEFDGISKLTLTVPIEDGRMNICIQLASLNNTTNKIHQRSEGKFGACKCGGNKWGISDTSEKSK